MCPIMCPIMQVLNLPFEVLVDNFETNTSTSTDSERIQIQLGVATAVCIDLFV